MQLSLPDPLELTRQTLRRVALHTLGEDDPDPAAAFRSPPGDPGLFGPNSASWRINADVSGFVGGVRALFLQTLHPLAMAGVAEHSNYRDEPLGRLRRTGQFIAVTTYGSTADADIAINAVRHIHTRIVGTAPDGRPYSASDPELLRWVHVTEVDSFARAHQRYGRQRLAPARYDDYVAEMAEVGHRLGAAALPTTLEGCRQYLRDIRPQLVFDTQARDAVRFLLAPNLPLPARPAMAVVSAAAIDLLPAWARRMMGFPPTVLGVNRVAVRPAARVTFGGLSWLLGEPPGYTGARERVAA